MHKDSQRGFTIIEMLIVLAVAGLILSMILVVIPTLQRNGRNNQRKQDTQAILAGISHYALNNSGNFPSAVSDIATGLKLSYYESNDTGIILQPKNAGQSVSDSPTLDTVIIANHQKCNIDQPGKATFVAAGYSDVVALYMTETGSGNTAQRCQEL